MVRSDFRVVLKGFRLLVDNARFTYVLVTCWCVCFFPLFLSDRLYVDDIGRVLFNEDNWTLGGRPIADALSKILFLGFPFDISPFLQLFALIVLSQAALLIILTFKNIISYPSIACAFTFGVSPYFLENMSYKFDSIWMALSIFFSTLPVYILREDIARKSKIYFMTTSLVISLCLYQASYGIFFVLGLFFVYKKVIEKSNRVSEFLFIITASCISSLVVYKAIVHFIKLPEYSIKYGAILPIPKIVAGVSENIIDFLKIFREDWLWNPVGILFLPLVVVFIIINVCRFRLYAVKKFLVLCFTIVLIPLSFILSHGLQLVLENPHWMSRTFVSVSIIPFLIFLCTPVCKKKLPNYFIISIYFLFSLQLGLLALGYGNLLGEQQRYENAVIIPIINDIEKLRRTYSIDNISIEGSLGHTPTMANISKKYPVLKKLVQVYLNDRWVWGFMYLLTLDKNLSSLSNFPVDKKLPSFVVATGPSYTIEKRSNSLVIVFCKCCWAW